MSNIRHIVITLAFTVAVAVVICLATDGALDRIREEVRDRVGADPPLASRWDAGPETADPVRSDDEKPSKDRR